MSNRVFKNYQINMGSPFQVRLPVNLQNIKPLKIPDIELKEEMPENKEDAAEIIAKAREEAELMLKEAQLEALRIIEKAKADAQEERNRLFEEAERQGFEEGAKVAQSQYDQLLRDAEEIKEGARVERAEVLASIEKDAVKVILDVAEKVIGRELRQEADSILYLVKQGFERCTGSEGVIVKVSPEDYEYLTENKETLSDMLGGKDDFDIKKDASMEQGSCILETSFGSVDAGAQTKLRKIGEAFGKVIV